MRKQTRLLLVYPPITKLERYGSKLGLFGGRHLPLGVFYLAAYIREKGFETGAIDAEARAMEPAEILVHLRAGEYTVLGISTTTVAFHRALELAKFVKRASPETTIIIGGPHVSSQPAQPLTFDAFDYAIRNEGEETLLEALQMIERGGSPDNIAGLVFRREGQVVVNPARPFVKELDSIPFPAYDLIPDRGVYSPAPFNSRKRPVASILTARGCPNECTFCERTTFGRTLRMRSAENVVSEIELHIRRYGAREIAFVDDTFTVRPQRIYEIFDLCRRRGLRFPWSCMSRVNTVDEQLLRYMRDNGCWYIAFGIESGDEAILKRIRKNIQLASVERVVGVCRRLGIRTKGFFIVGHPGESVETLDKTIAFACKIALDHVVVTINTPMPGSYQFEHAREAGSLDDTSWAKFNYWNPVFVPEGLTRDILLAKQKEFLRRFYLRPGTMARNIWSMMTDLAGIQQCGEVLWDLVRGSSSTRGLRNGARTHPAPVEGERHAGNES